MNKTFAISYLRYSHKSQGRKDKDSYRRQFEATEDYCNRNGLTLNSRLEDLGVSGWDKSNLDDRAALGGFLKLVEAGKIPRGTVLICENLDRLTRADILDALTLFISIIRKGIDIVTTMDGMRYSEASIRENPTQLMISITILTRGNNESETKSKRVRDSWDKRRKQIRNNEFAKINCPSWLRHDGTKYNLIEDRAATVKQVFKLYVSGYGVYSLAHELNRRKIKPFTKTGKWTAVFLHELLQNPAVIGTYHLIDPPQKGYFPPAIPEDLFYQALAQRKSNCNHRGKTGTKEINIFGGLVKCHKCGSNLVKYQCANSKGTKYEALICSQAKLKKCKYEFTNWKKFQDSFYHVFTSEHFEKFVEDTADTPTEDRTGAIEGQLLEVNGNLKRVARILARTDSEALETQLASLESERKALEEQLQAETIKVKTRTNKAADWRSYVSKFRKKINDAGFRLSLREFMRKSIEGITCHAEKYKVIFKDGKGCVNIEFLKEGYEVGGDGILNYRVTDFA